MGVEHGLGTCSERAPQMTPALKCVTLLSLFAGLRCACYLSEFAFAVLHLYNSSSYLHNRITHGVALLHMFLTGICTGGLYHIWFSFARFAATIGSQQEVPCDTCICFQGGAKDFWYKHGNSWTCKYRNNVWHHEQLHTVLCIKSAQVHRAHRHKDDQ